MIKAISSVNRLMKAGLVAGMLSCATAAYTTNPIKNETQPNQTEVISKEGAEALKTTTLQAVTQSTIPTVQHSDLNESLRKYIENEEDRKYFNNIINNVYKQNGTYLACVKLQREIDFQHLYTFVSKNPDILIKNNIDAKFGKQIKDFGPDFFKTLDSGKTKLIMTWVNDIYNIEMNKLLRFGHKPNVNEVCDRIDEIVDNSDYLNSNEKLKYYKECDKYLELKLEPQTPQSAAYIPARQMFILDKIIFEKVLKKIGVFNEKQFNDGSKNMQYYFNKWMDIVTPDVRYRRLNEINKQLIKPKT